MRTTTQLLHGAGTATLSGDRPLAVTHLALPDAHLALLLTAALTVLLCGLIIMLVGHRLNRA